MPKVSSIRLTIEGDTKEFPIHYSKSMKFHIKDFPAHILIYANKSNKASFETEAELTKFFKETLEKYHTSISKTRKVIAFQIEATQNLTHFMDKERHRWVIKPGISEENARKIRCGSARESDFGFEISYGVYFERSDNGTKYYSIKEDGNIGYQTTPNQGDKNIIIEWTPKRQAFFETMKQNMGALLFKILDVMMNEEKLLPMMDSSTNILA